MKIGEWAKAWKEIRGWSQELKMGLCKEIFTGSLVWLLILLVLLAICVFKP